MSAKPDSHILMKFCEYLCLRCTRDPEFITSETNMSASYLHLKFGMREHLKLGFMKY